MVFPTVVLQHPHCCPNLQHTAQSRTHIKNIHHGMGYETKYECSTLCMSEIFRKIQRHAAK